MSVPLIYGQELIDAIKMHDKIAIDKILGDKKKVNVNFADDKRQTPLCYAIQEEQYDLAERLLKMGANPKYFGEETWEATRKFASTPLEAAIRTGKIEFVKLLLYWKADVNQSTGEYMGTPDCREQILQSLEKVPDRKFLYTGFGDSHLAIAASLGYSEIVKLLMKNGADARYKYKGSNGDQRIVTSQNTEIREMAHPLTLKILLQKDNQTILRPSSSYTEQIEKLLAWHDSHKDSPLPIEFNKPLNKSNLTTMMTAIGLGHWKIARLMHKLGIPLPSDIDINNSSLAPNSINVLTLAINSLNVDTVRWILSVLGPTVNLNAVFKFKDQIEFTSLGLAAHNCLDYYMVSLLIDHGADVNFLSSNGYCPLVAAYNNINRHGENDLSVVTHMALLLLDRGANPDLVDNFYKDKSDLQQSYHVIKYFQETYKEFTTVLTPKIIKLLVSSVEVEYYRRTGDPLRNKAEKLLERLIYLTAEHAAPIIVEIHKSVFNTDILKQKDIKSDESSRKKLQERKERLSRAYASDLMKNMVKNSITNKLLLILKRPPLYALQSQFSYELSAFSTPIMHKMLSVSAIRTYDFFAEINSYLTEEFSTKHFSTDEINHGLRKSIEKSKVPQSMWSGVISGFTSLLPKALSFRYTGSVMPPSSKATKEVRVMPQPDTLVRLQAIMGPTECAIMQFTKPKIVTPEKSETPATTEHKTTQEVKTLAETGEGEITTSVTDKLSKDDKLFKADFIKTLRELHDARAIIVKGIMFKYHRAKARLESDKTSVKESDKKSEKESEKISEKKVPQIKTDVAFEVPETQRRDKDSDPRAKGFVIKFS